jgi:hypothetical protein
MCLRPVLSDLHAPTRCSWCTASRRARVEGAWAGDDTECEDRKRPAGVAGDPANPVDGRPMLCPWTSPTSSQHVPPSAAFSRPGTPSYSKPPNRRGSRSPSSLTASVWSRRRSTLGGAGASQPRPSSAKARVHRHSRVRVVDHDRPSTSRPSLELRLQGSRRILVPEGFDVDTLVALVATLERC